MYYFKYILINSQLSLLILIFNIILFDCKYYKIYWHLHFIPITVKYLLNYCILIKTTFVLQFHEQCKFVCT